MAKELPYFRFTVQDWQNGKISLESFELQGLFISICGYYWINDCNLTLSMIIKKFKNENLILELIDLNIIKHEKRHDKIEIEFLNLQYDLLSEKRKARQNAGSKGGNAKAMLKQNNSYKDNNKDKDKNKNKNKFDFKNSLLEFSKNNQLVEDWLLVRKNKKATNTKTAFDSFMNEVNISDLTIDEILKICVEKSWSGYKFKWIQNLRSTESKELKSNIITLAVESHSKGINLIEQKYGNKPNDIGSLGN